MIVKPFRGVRPRSDLASRIASYPYDVLSTEEARALAGQDPFSFLHVIRPEIDLDPAVDPHDEQVYARGRENFLSMTERGWLVRDERPAFYVYRLRMGTQEQTGIVCAASVDDYLGGSIKKHEHTRPGKEQDRVRLIDALSAHPGPIFLTYRGRRELDELIDAATSLKAEVAFTAADGVEHTLWVVADTEATTRIERHFATVDSGYVADGHHRTAAAARVCAERRGRLTQVTGSEPCNYFLAVYFPAEQLQVLDYNRVVKDLNGLSAESFIEKLRAAGFEVRPGHVARKPPRRRSFGMYLAGGWFLLEAVPDPVGATDLLDDLDVSILGRRILEPILGIGDPRTDERIDFVGGIRGAEALEASVDAGEHAVAFALYPTSLADVIQVADAGQVMPPKSTWFEPKLRSGLVIQLLDGESL